MADYQEIYTHVIKQLANYKPRDEILWEMCTRYDLKWDDAVKIFERIEAESHDQVQSRRRPLVLFVNLGLAIGGSLLALTMLILALFGVMIILLRLPIPYLGNIIFGLAGVGMAARGVLGVIQTLQGKEV